MEKDLDCRGLDCPGPVVRCRELLASEHPVLLRVLVSNAAASENVSRFLTRNGYTTTVEHNTDKEWTITANCSCQVTEPEPETKQKASSEAKTLVLITTQTLGRGDDTLGAKLMENFLGNLSELGSSLWRVILLNGGVKLSATKGPALEHLKKLEAAGVGIFVCGTCLNHYGLLEQKETGETTNMLDIMSSLALADKVIRP